MVTGKHNAKPKAISCKALIAPSLLIHDVAVDTGTAPDVDPATEANPHYDKRGPYVGITLRMCLMLFANNDTTGAYGHSPSDLAPGFLWYAGTAVTTRQFNRIYRHESVNGGLMTQIGPPFAKRHIASLGAGSHAFLTTTGLMCCDSNPTGWSGHGR